MEPANDRPNRRALARRASLDTPRPYRTYKAQRARYSPAAALCPRVGRRRHWLAARVYSSCLLPRSGGTSYRLAAGKSVSVRGGGSRRGLGPPGLPVPLDWRHVLACDGARLVVLHARGHIRPPGPDIARGKLCSLQFPADLHGRFRRGLAVGAAVSLLPLRRVSEAGPSPGQRAAVAPERVPLGRTRPLQPRCARLPACGADARKFKSASAVASGASSGAECPAPAIRVKSSAPGRPATYASPWARGTMRSAAPQITAAGMAAR